MSTLRMRTLLAVISDSLCRFLSVLMQTNSVLSLLSISQFADIQQPMALTYYVRAADAERACSVLQCK